MPTISSRDGVDPARVETVLALPHERLARQLQEHTAKRAGERQAGPAGLLRLDGHPLSA